MNQTIIFKGKEIHPYESFYHDVTENFNRGELGGYFEMRKNNSKLSNYGRNTNEPKWRRETRSG